MKKRVSLLLLLALVIILIPQKAEARQVKIIVDGEEVVSDVAPFIEEGRTFVPVRAIAEALGMEVDYFPAGFADEYGYEDAVTLTAENGRMISIRKYSVHSSDGAEFDYGKSGEAYILRNDRTFLPLRCLGNAMHMDVSWDQDSYTATLTTNNEETIYPMKKVIDVEGPDGYVYKDITYHVIWKDGQYMIKELGITFQEEMDKQMEILENRISEKTEFYNVVGNDNHMILEINGEYFWTIVAG